MSPVVRDTSFIETRSPNMALQFRERVASSPNSEAYRYPAEDGQPWVSMTWKDTGELVEKWAAGLLALGITSEERVGIAAGTRVEWIVADLAVMCAGAATTTVYPSTMAEDVAYILADSGSRVVFAEDDAQVAKLRDNRASLPDLFKIVVFEGTTDGDWIIGLDDLAELGEKHLAAHPDAIDQAVAGIKPGQLATLIYTSGTTGKPKGVRLTHSSWTYEGAVVQSQKILDESDLQFLWLPMAHSFGKVLLSAQLACGFATAVDGRVDRIIDNLAIVRPTFMGAAPRIFEKAYARIITMQESEGGAKEKIFNAAFAVGKQVDALKFAGKSVPITLKLQHAVFDRLVFSKIRDRFGGRVRFFLSGSAALNREIAEWFHAAGILILEGYGLTETSAGAFVNSPDDYKIGTVGQVFPGGEVRLGDGDEIQIKGPNIMDGYHNMPEETAKTLTEDGWLHTGDKGSIDADGFLTITGRIKELFKTSGGKYVAPPAIEAKMKAICPYVSQFMVFGNERNYCIALVTLDPDAMKGWAAENGQAGASYADLVASAPVHAMVQAYVDELNGQLNRWETVKKFELLDHDLTIESGELTPSLKVKRNVVEENNKAIIDALYA
ncbi:MAG: AMP-dependent synthetase and ligase [Marmoricola sp.]|nr:AMP-dependent synthetase and ligase [Marmoricola sp.]